METKKRTSIPVILMRVVFTCMLIYSVGFIFGNSLEIAQESAAHSQEILEMVNGALHKVHMGPMKLHTLRKLAHFTEFLFMGFWFMLCLRVYTKHFIKHVSWPLFFGLLIAVLDETVQLFVPGRSSSTIDVLIDFSGVLTGLFVALLILMFVQMCCILFKYRDKE